MVLQVIGIRLADPQNLRSKITHIAYEGILFTPKTIIDVEQVIKMITNHEHRFYVIYLDRVFYLSLVKPRHEKSFLHAGTIKGMNLLYTLQQC